MCASVFSAQTSESDYDGPRRAQAFDATSQFHPRLGAAYSRFLHAPSYSRPEICPACSHILTPSSSKHAHCESLSLPHFFRDAAASSTSRALLLTMTPDQVAEYLRNQARYRDPRTTDMADTEPTREEEPRPEVQDDDNNDEVRSSLPRTEIPPSLVFDRIRTAWLWRARSRPRVLDTTEC